MKLIDCLIYIQWKPSAKKKTNKKRRKKTKQATNRIQFDNLTGITRNESSARELYTGKHSLLHMVF